MRSSFSGNRRQIQATSLVKIDETYDLKGLNLTLPDEVMKQGETPYTINSRMYARNDEESRVANRTRKGASHLSDPIGETADTSNTATSTGDAEITTTRILLQKWTAGANGALTKLEPHIKKAAGARGHIIVEVYSDNSGFPGQLLGQGSILAQDITTSYQYLPAYFIEAPTIANASDYWVAYYVQDNGSGSYYINQTAGSDAMYSVDELVSLSSLGGDTRFKTYLSTAKGVEGWHLYYPSSAANNRILIASNGKLYTVVKSTGVATEIADVQADVPVRMDQVDDKVIFVDGFSTAKWWDGTDVTVVNNVPVADPKNVIIWNNRAFFQTGPTRYDFSGLYDFESYRSVDFFYVPNPKSADHVVGHVIFRDNLTIFTHETKHIIIGTNLSNFTRKEAVGTKGAVSQEAIVADRNYIYFMADDKMIYKWAGGDDIPVSIKMEPEFQGIQDPSKVRLSLSRGQLRVYYSKTSGYNDRMALYDINFDQWFMDTDHPCVGATELYLDNNELIEFSSLVGRIYYGETQYSDLGRRIDWKYWTNYKSYGSAAARKRVKRFRPILRTADADYTMLVGKDMDFNNTPDMREYIVSSGGAKWGEFVWGDGTVWGGSKHTQEKAPMSGRGNHIQYRFERSGVDTPVELYGYSSQYKTGRPK